MTSPTRATEAQLAKAEVAQIALTKERASLVRRMKKTPQEATRVKALVREISNLEKKVLQEATRVKALDRETSNQEKKALPEVTRAKAQDLETSNLEKAEKVVPPEVTRVKAVKRETSNQEHQELVMAKLLKQEVTSKKTTLLQVQKNHSESLMIKKVEAREVQTADLLEREKKMATDRRLMHVVTKTPLSGVENQHHQKRMMA